MHYEIGNLPWDILKFFLGAWFGACWVYGNRHVTTKSLHQGMLNTLRSQRERINELLGGSGAHEDSEMILEEVEEVELEEESHFYRQATIVPQPHQPSPSKPVRVYQEYKAIASTKQQIRNLEKAPTHIRRLTRKDDGSGTGG